MTTKLTTVRRYLRLQGRSYPKPDLPDGAISLDAFVQAGVAMVVSCTGCDMTMVCSPSGTVVETTGAIYCDHCAQVFAPNDVLSRAASEIWKLSRDHDEAAEFDAGFDAGEWSGPAHADAEEREQEAIAHKYGYKHASALWKAIAERTNAKWMFFNFPPCLRRDEYESDSTHGRNANR